MKKNIGILFSSSRKMGVFQYGLSIAECLINHCDDFDYTILYFEKESPKDFLKVKNLKNANFISLSADPNNFLGKINFLLNCFLGKPIFATNKKNREIMKSVKIDLLIIPFQLMFGFENNIPYIMSVPDLMYKYYPEFPEYSFKDRLISDIIFTYSTKYSLLNIVDSDCGSKDLQKFFKVAEEKIKPIPYLPAGYIFELKDMDLTKANELLKKYNLPEKFIFYPAQFWAHKNHFRLIRAIKIAEEKHGQKINLVLAGNDKANSDNYRKIMDLAGELKIKDRILHLGYVKDEEIVALYKKTVALVFVSLGGPTNIPLVEAIILGTPVACSDLFAMPEQVGSAGILFNPFIPEDIAEKISHLWSNENLRKDLARNAKKMAESITAESFTNKWKSAINEALLILNKNNGKRY